MYRMAFSNGLPVENSALAVPVSPIVQVADIRPKEREEDPAVRPSKVARQVQDRLDELEAEGRLDAKVSVIVSFEDHFKMPRFPQLDPSRPRTDPVNARKRARSQKLVNHIVSTRSSEYAVREAEVLATHGAHVRDKLWMSNGLILDVPAREIDRLANRPDVVSIDPTEGGQLANMAWSRGLMDTDPYESLGLTGGYIGMLDSGVRENRDHVLFYTGRIALALDCVNGGTNCNNSAAPDWNPWDTLGTDGHGTGVAAIMSGTSILGNAFRGVTSIKVDSFKVITAAGAVSFAAVDRAYLRAAAVGDWATNASLNTFTSANSAVAAAADNAFDAGLVVIAAAGNEGPTYGSVGCPGNARKVLAVGAIDTSESFQNGTRTVLGFSGRGPTSDNRIKPDLIAPTNVTTASRASSTATWTYGGTSGATPHVTGAAMLWMNWIKASFPATEPGSFYSDLIAMGERVSFNNIAGAGVPPLLLDGWWTHNKANVTNAVNVDIPLSVTGSVSRIDVAIWWPESIGGAHNDVDLRLVNPSGSVVASSTSVDSVFEKVREDTSQLGTWKVRLTGYSVTGTQPVYWTALIRD